MTSHIRLDIVVGEETRAQEAADALAVAMGSCLKAMGFTVVKTTASVVGAPPVLEQPVKIHLASNQARYITSRRGFEHLTSTACGTAHRRSTVADVSLVNCRSCLNTKLGKARAAKAMKGIS